MGAIIRFVAVVGFLSASALAKEYPIDEGAADAHKTIASDAQKPTGLLALIPRIASGACAFLSHDEATVPGNVIHVRVSRSFLNHYVDRQIERREKVVDSVLGTAVYGTSQTAGQTQLVLVEHEQLAMNELRVSGQTFFNATGYAGPVRIPTRGVTHFRATKRFWFDQNGFHTAPTSIKAETQSTATGVFTNLPGPLGRLVTRIGTRREQENHAAAEHVIAQHTAQRVKQHIDQVLEERVANILRAVNEAGCRSISERLFAGCGIQCQTAPDYLQIAVGRARQTVPHEAAPTWDAGRPDIEVHMHIGLVRKALADRPLLEKLQLVADKFRAKQKVAVVPVTLTHEAPTYNVQWSKDYSWLTLTWNRNGRLPPKERRETGSDSKSESVRNPERYEVLKPPVIDGLPYVR